jgi:hypothetical protein
LQQCLSYGYNVLRFNKINKEKGTMLKIDLASKRLTSLVAASAVITMLGVAAMPAMAGAATANTTISSAVSSVVSVTTSSTVTVDVTPDTNGNQTIADDTVSVSTNDSDGYTLTLADSDATVTLASGGDTIAASAGNYATPVDLAVNTWGYRVDTLGNFGAGPTTDQTSIDIAATSLTFAAVPATGSPVTLKTTSAEATGDTTAVWYSVAATTATPTGTYTDSVTYTATAN